MKRFLLILAVLVGMTVASATPASAGWRRAGFYSPYGGYWGGPGFYGPTYTPAYRPYYGYYRGWGPSAYPSYYGYGSYYPGYGVGVGIY